MAFLSWNVELSGIDIEHELALTTALSPEGDVAKSGERLIQNASEHLVTEILIKPQISTLRQCIRNLLSSFTKYRYIIHAGYAFCGNGSWILEDGTFSMGDFIDAFHEIEVQRVMRAYEKTIKVDICCIAEGSWNQARINQEPFSKLCRIEINPSDKLSSMNAAIREFVNYLDTFIVAQDICDLLASSDVVGNIRFSRPTLYVFPGGDGDAALFGINGFNMLVDGGFNRRACFWNFVRHLDRLDAILLTRISNTTVGGMAGIVQRKVQSPVYPQIGHFFSNLQSSRTLPSSDGNKDKEPLLVNLIQEGDNLVMNLKKLQLKPHSCYRGSNSDPINLYHKVGHGKLDMYVISPAKDSREVKEFLNRWHNHDVKLFAGGSTGFSAKEERELHIPIQNLISICALLIWQPANAEDRVTRILFPGSAPEHKILEGFDRMKHMNFLKSPVCLMKSILPAMHTVTTTKSMKLKLGKGEQISHIISDTTEKLIPDNETKKMNTQLPENEISKYDRKRSDNITKTQEKYKQGDKAVLSTQTKSVNMKEKQVCAPTEKKNFVEEKVEGKSTEINTTGLIKNDSKKVEKKIIPTEKKTKSSIAEKKLDSNKSSPTTPKKTLITKEATTSSALTAAAAALIKDTSNNKTVSSAISRTATNIPPKTLPAKRLKEENNRRMVEAKQDTKVPLSAEAKHDIKVLQSKLTTFSATTAITKPTLSTTETSKTIKKEPNKSKTTVKVSKQTTTSTQSISPSALIKMSRKSSSPNHLPKKTDEQKKLSKTEEKKNKTIKKFSSISKNGINEAVKKPSKDKLTDISINETITIEDIDNSTFVSNIMRKEIEGDEDEILIIETTEIKPQEPFENVYTDSKYLRDEKESEKGTNKDQEKNGAIMAVKKCDTDINSTTKSISTLLTPEEKENIFDQLKGIISTATEIVSTSIEFPKTENLSEEDDFDALLRKKVENKKETSKKEIILLSASTEKDDKVLNTDGENAVNKSSSTDTTISEDNKIDDKKQEIEEKYDKEDTKEKSTDKLSSRNASPIEHQEVEYDEHQLIITAIHQNRESKNILMLKTPDEVADLPVHEEVPEDTYNADNKLYGIHITEQPIVAQVATPQLPEVITITPSSSPEEKVKSISLEAELHKSVTSTKIKDIPPIVTPSLKEDTTFISLEDPKEDVKLLNTISKEDIDPSMEAALLDEKGFPFTSSIVVKKDTTSLDTEILQDNIDDTFLTTLGVSKHITDEEVHTTSTITASKKGITFKTIDTISLESEISQKDIQSVTTDILQEEVIPSKKEEVFLPSPTYSKDKEAHPTSQTAISEEDITFKITDSTSLKSQSHQKNTQSSSSEITTDSLKEKEITIFKVEDSLPPVTLAINEKAHSSSPTHIFEKDETFKMTDPTSLESDSSQKDIQSSGSEITIDTFNGEQICSSRVHDSLPPATLSIDEAQTILPIAISEKDTTFKITDATSIKSQSPQKDIQLSSSEITIDTLNNEVIPGSKEKSFIRPAMLSLDEEHISPTAISKKDITFKTIDSTSLESQIPQEDIQSGITPDIIKEKVVPSEKIEASLTSSTDSDDKEACTTSPTSISEKNVTIKTDALFSESQSPLKDIQSSSSEITIDTLNNKVIPGSKVEASPYPAILSIDEDVTTSITSTYEENVTFKTTDANSLKSQSPQLDIQSLNSEITMDSINEREIPSSKVDDSLPLATISIVQTHPTSLTAISKKDFSLTITDADSTKSQSRQKKMESSSSEIIIDTINEEEITSLKVETSLPIATLSVKEEANTTSTIGASGKNITNKIIDATSLECEPLNKDFQSSSSEITTDSLKEREITIFKVEDSLPPATLAINEKAHSGSSTCIFEKDETFKITDPTSLESDSSQKDTQSSGSEITIDTFNGEQICSSKVYDSLPPATLLIDEACTTLPTAIEKDTTFKITDATSIKSQLPQKDIQSSSAEIIINTLNEKSELNSKLEGSLNPTTSSIDEETHSTSSTAISKKDILFKIIDSNFVKSQSPQKDIQSSDSQITIESINETGIPNSKVDESLPPATPLMDKAHPTFPAAVSKGDILPKTINTTSSESQSPQKDIQPSGSEITIDSINEREILSTKVDDSLPQATTSIIEAHTSLIAISKTNISPKTIDATTLESQSPQKDIQSSINILNAKEIYSSKVDASLPPTTLSIDKVHTTSPTALSEKDATFKIIDTTFLKSQSIIDEKATSPILATPHLDTKSTSFETAVEYNKLSLDDKSTLGTTTVTETFPPSISLEEITSLRVDDQKYITLDPITNVITEELKDVDLNEETLSIHIKSLRDLKGSTNIESQPINKSKKSIIQSNIDRKMSIELQSSLKSNQQESLSTELPTSMLETTKMSSKESRIKITDPNYVSDISIKSNETTPTEYDIKDEEFKGKLWKTPITQPSTEVENESIPQKVSTNYYKLDLISNDEVESNQSSIDLDITTVEKDSKRLSQLSKPSFEKRMTMEEIEKGRNQLRRKSSSSEVQVDNDQNELYIKREESDLPHLHSETKLQKSNADQRLEQEASILSITSTELKTSSSSKFDNKYIDNIQLQIKDQLQSDSDNSKTTSERRTSIILDGDKVDNKVLFTKDKYDSKMLESVIISEDRDKKLKYVESEEKQEQEFVPSMPTYSINLNESVTDKNNITIEEKSKCLKSSSLEEEDKVILKQTDEKLLDNKQVKDFNKESTTGGEFKKVEEKEELSTSLLEVNTSTQDQTSSHLILDTTEEILTTSFKKSISLDETTTCNNGQESHPSSNAIEEAHQISSKHDIYVDPISEIKLLDTETSIIILTENNVNDPSTDEEYINTTSTTTSTLVLESNDTTNLKSTTSFTSEPDNKGLTEEILPTFEEYKVGENIDLPKDVSVDTNIIEKQSSSLSPKKGQPINEIETKKEQVTTSTAFISPKTEEIESVHTIPNISDPSIKMTSNVPSYLLEDKDKAAISTSLSSLQDSTLIGRLTDAANEVKVEKIKEISTKEEQKITEPIDLQLVRESLFELPLHTETSKEESSTTHKDVISPALQLNAATLSVKFKSSITDPSSYKSDSIENCEEKKRSHTPILTSKANSENIMLVSTNLDTRFEKRDSIAKTISLPILDNNCQPLGKDSEKVDLKTTMGPETDFSKSYPCLEKILYEDTSAISPDLTLTKQLANSELKSKSISLPVIKQPDDSNKYMELPHLYKMNKLEDLTSVIVTEEVNADGTIETITTTISDSPEQLTSKPQLHESSIIFSNIDPIKEADEPHSEDESFHLQDAENDKPRGKKVVDQELKEEIHYDIMTTSIYAPVPSTEGSHYYEEKSSHTIPTSMTQSIYGSFSSDELDIHSKTKTLEVTSKHLQEKEDEANNTMTSEPTSEQLREKEDKSRDPIGDWGKPLGLPSTDNANNFNSLLIWNPLEGWGRPLGLPSPGPPPSSLQTQYRNSDGDIEINLTPINNKTTPKKMVTKKSSIGRETSRTRESSTTKKTTTSSKQAPPVYVDLAYIPHYGNPYYTSLEFFKRIRARYYVFSGTDPSKDVLNALLEAKKLWGNPDLKVTIIPTYDTDVLGYWITENEAILSSLKIDLAPSASRCTINLQDHDTSCSAYRLEF